MRFIGTPKFFRFNYGLIPFFFIHTKGQTLRVQVRGRGLSCFCNDAIQIALQLEVVSLDVGNIHFQGFLRIVHRVELGVYLIQSCLRFVHISVY